MEHNDPLLNKLRESMTQGKAKAPAHLWQGIENGLTQQSQKFPPSLEEALRQAFAQRQQSAPPKVWQKIDRQLRLDQVWSGIDKALNEKTCPPSLALDQQLRQAFEQQPRRTAPKQAWQKVDRQLQIDRTWQRIQGHLPLSKPLHLGYPWLRWLFTTLALFPYFHIGLESSFPPPSLPLAAGSLNTAQTAKPSLGMRVLWQHWSLVQQSLGQGSNPPSLAWAMPSKQKMPMLASPAQDKNSNAEEQTSVNVAKPQAPQAQEVMTSSKELGPLPQVQALLPLSITQQTTRASVEKIPQLKPQRQLTWEAGMLYSFTTGWVMNADTRRSLNVNSLISTTALGNHSFGLVAMRHLSNKDALVLAFKPQTKIRQDFSYYEQGVFKQKRMEFEYLRMEVLYQRNLWQYHRNHNLVGVIGAYGARLRYQTESYEQIKINRTTYYSSYDYGLSFQLGQESRFKSFTLAYGLHGSVGVHNVANMRLQNIQANLHNLGAHIQFRYQIP
jgi:hypothetical protein